MSSSRANGRLDPRCAADSRSMYPPVGSPTVGALCHRPRYGAFSAYDTPPSLCRFLPSVELLVTLALHKVPLRAARTRLRCKHKAEIDGPHTAPGSVALRHGSPAGAFLTTEVATAIILAVGTVTTAVAAKEPRNALDFPVIVVGGGIGGTYTAWRLAVDAEAVLPEHCMYLFEATWQFRRICSLDDVPGCDCYVVMPAALSVVPEPDVRVVMLWFIIGLHSHRSVRRLTAAPSAALLPSRSRIWTGTWSARSRGTFTGAQRAAFRRSSVRCRQWVRRRRRG